MRLPLSVSRVYLVIFKNDIKCASASADRVTLCHSATVIKVSPRIKNHHFSKFAIFRRLSRAHQELSFKKTPEKMFFLCRLMECKRFFYANYFNLIVDKSCHTWYACRCTLNQANQAIWQKSWFTSIVLTVFPWSLKVNASIEEKRACPFSPRLRPRQNKMPPKSGLRN